MMRIWVNSSLLLFGNTSSDLSACGYATFEYKMRISLVSSFATRLFKLEFNVAILWSVIVSVNCSQTGVLTQPGAPARKSGYDHL